MQKITAFFRLIRIANLFIIALGLSLFYYLIIIPVHKDKLHTMLVPFTNMEFVLFVASVLFIAAAGYVINDYFDFELDREYKPGRPLSAGLISLDNALYLHVVFAIAGITLGFYLGWGVDNYKIGYLYIICALLLYGYSSYLKKIPFAGNLVVAGLTGFVFVLLLIFEAAYLRAIHAQNLFETTGFAFNILLWQMKFYASFAFLTNLAREIIKDIEDKEGDMNFNINTIVVQFGDNAAKICAGLVLLILLFGLCFFMHGFYAVNAKKEFYYLLLAVAVPVLAAIGLLLVARNEKDYRRLSLLMKLVMLTGLLSIPAFYLFNHSFAA